MFQWQKSFLPVSDPGNGGGGDFSQEQNMSSSRLQCALLSRVACSWASKVGFWLLMQVLKHKSGSVAWKLSFILNTISFRRQTTLKCLLSTLALAHIFLSEYTHPTHWSSFLVLPWCLTYYHHHETWGSNCTHTHTHIVFTVCSESRLWRQPTKWHSFLEAHFLVMDVLLPWLVKWWTVKQYCVSRKI